MQTGEIQGGHPPGGCAELYRRRVSPLTTEKIKKSNKRPFTDVQLRDIIILMEIWRIQKQANRCEFFRCGISAEGNGGVGQMTLSDALKTMSKRSKLPYKKWGEKAGGVTYSVISSPITRNDCMVSTLVKLAEAAGYDLLLVRRHQIDGYEEPILIDDAGREKGENGG